MPLNTADVTGRTPLQAAMDRGHWDCVELLLLHPAVDVYVEDAYGNTPVHAFLSQRGVRGAADLLNAFFEHRMVDLDLGNRYGVTPLMVAAGNVHACAYSEPYVSTLSRAAAAMMASGTDGTVSAGGLTSRGACEARKAEEAQLPVASVTDKSNALLPSPGRHKPPARSSRASPPSARHPPMEPRIADSKSGNEAQPLTVDGQPAKLQAKSKTRDGRTSLVQMLIDRKADIRAKDCHGKTPLDYACAAGNMDDVVTLVENMLSKHDSCESRCRGTGGDAEGQCSSLDSELTQALFSAVGEGAAADMHVVRYLIDQVNVQLMLHDEMQDNVWIVAARYGRFHCIKELAKRPNWRTCVKRNTLGMTALHAAVWVSGSSACAAASVLPRTCAYLNLLLTVAQSAQSKQSALPRTLDDSAAPPSLQCA